MGWYGYSNTGTCCCNAGQSGNACVLTQDDFNRADDTDLGTDWDEVVAGVEISGNQALANANGATAIATRANPDSSATRVDVRIQLGDAAATAKLFIGWASASNHLYATISATAITVGQAGGASTSTSVTIVPGTQYVATLCLNGDKLIGNVNGKQAMLAVGLPSGNKHGFGVGTASVLFDDFVATKVSQSCSRCTSTVNCASCCDNGSPAELILDATGLSGVNDECSNCGDLPVEFIVPFQGNILGTCRYSYSEQFCDWPCGRAAGALCGGTFILMVTIEVAGCGVLATILLGGVGGQDACPCDFNIATATYESPLNSWTGDCTGPLVLNRTYQSIRPADPNPREGPACVMTFPETLTMTA